MDLKCVGGAYCIKAIYLGSISPLILSLPVILMTIIIIIISYFFIFFYIFFFENSTTKRLLVLYSKVILFVDMSLVVQYVDAVNIQPLASMGIQFHKRNQNHAPNELLHLKYYIGQKIFVNKYNS